MVSRLTLWRIFARATRRELVVGARLPAADLIPEHLPTRVAVLVDGSNGPSWISFACPCATGHHVMISLAQSRRPRWQLTGPRRTPTLYPSVDAADGPLRCHFWVRAGRVQWAEPPRTATPRNAWSEDEP